MLFADDTQIYITCKKPVFIQSALEDCIYDIRDWMRDNYLILNDAKTEVMVFTSMFNRNKKEVLIDTLKVGTSDVKISTVVRNLGAIFDVSLSMSDHVRQVCRSASFALYRIGKIRRFLDGPTTEKLVHAFITSKLDYCNSLLLGIHDCQIYKLQLIQNSAARLVTLTRKYEHITPVLKDLHWLPVCMRIKFKVLLIVFKIIHGLAPSYLSEIIDIKTALRMTRSQSIILLKPYVPIPNVYYGGRAFASAAPGLWNVLPESLMFAPNIDIFKSRLKTHLFKLYFD
jgi:hypothetical protein